MQVQMLIALWRDRTGQDFIEYALMAGFITVAVGATFPDIASQITTIFSKVNSIMLGASSGS